MKGMVKAIIGGCIFIAIGVVILLIALGLNGWSITPNYEMKTYNATETNTTVKLNFNAGEVKTEFYNGDKIVVEYPEIENYSTTIKEENGTLTFSGPRKQHWYNFSFGWNKIPKTIIKLPQNTAFNLDFEVNAGTVTVAEGAYGTVKIQLNAGTVKVNGIAECTSFTGTVNAGSANVKNVNCEGKFRCEVNAGSINIDGLTCDDIDTEVNAGSLNLKINGNKTDYTIFVDKSAGSCSVEEQTGTGGKTLAIDVSAGSANVTFAS